MNSTFVCAITARVRKTWTFWKMGEGMERASVVGAMRDEYDGLAYT